MVTMTLAKVGDVMLCSLVKEFVPNAPKLTKPYGFTFHSDRLRQVIVLFLRHSGVSELHRLPVSSRTLS